MTWLNGFLFAGLPYIALAVFFVGTIVRYRSTGFKVSSLSSQFLEGKNLFWGAVPFHWGILVVLLGHLLAFLIPDALLLWNGNPVRLIVLEVTGFSFGLAVLVGLGFLLVRRLTNQRLRMVTNRMDIVIEVILLAQVIFGLWIALGYRWGSSWFAADLSPYLWSILLLNPQTAAVSAMPLVIQLHIVLAFVIILLVPFTRLVHFLVAPLHYIGRPYQRVIWAWDRRKVRDADNGWTPTRPKNN
jgi:nitrate reductase gamma subunit